MTLIKWVSGERIIPCQGHVIRGQEKELPDALAKLFIKQGCAVLANKAVKSDKEDTK